MNKVLLRVLQTILRSLIGSLNYERLSLLVEDANQAAWSGEEKRAWVAREALKMGLAMRTALLNLAIETAVVVLKSKLERS